MFQDLRYALRTLRKSPAFTLAAICTLTLGIGANTAIFQLLDAVRLRTLPVPDPQELVRIQVRNGNGGRGISRDIYALTFQLWEGIRDHQQAFSGVLAWTTDSFRIGEGTQTRRGSGLIVSGDFFSTLEVPPAAGRLFGPEDDRPGCPASAVVISYALWQSQFGGQRSAIGSKLIVNDHPFQVVGVTPAIFSGIEVGRSFDFAVPICQTALRAGVSSTTRRDVWWLTVMGRLKPGWTRARAAEHLQAISPGLFEATVPSGYSQSSLESYKKLRLDAVPAANGISGLRNQYDTSLWLLLGITGLVLLIACANLANLMLARASARQREFAVRLALGAGRGRLVGQLLSESLLLAFTGAILGLTLARVLSETIVAFLTTESNALHLDLSMDWNMLAFTTAVAMVACVVFGLVPALRSSRTDPGSAMKAGGCGLTSDRERFGFQRLLVILQISISLVLVAGALLFVQSFRNLMTLDPGFREKGILISFVDLNIFRRLPPNAIRPLQRELLEEIRAVPQVEAVATATNTFLNGSSWTLGVRMEGGQGGSSKFTWVSPSFFETMEIPLLAGRNFNAGDTETSPKVVIVNQTFVRLYLGGANPIGRTFRTVAEPNYPAAECEIVGVTRDTKYADLREPTPPMSYAPAEQNPNGGPWGALYIRSSAPAASVMSAIRQRMSELHPGIAMEFRVFERQVRDGLIRERLMAALSGFFGVLAALLATIGLYGVIAYVVIRRRNEIGIRMALGSSRGQVVGLILKEAALMLVVGIGIGVVCSLVFARMASSLLFGLTAHDPVTFVAAAGLLAVVAAAGSYLPAQRAARLDPMSALRDE